MNKESKIFIAGHKGLVGSTFFNKLKQDGYTNIIVKTSDELDLKNQQAVAAFFSVEKPEYVILAAAKVAVDQENDRLKASYLYENLMIQSNIIHYAYIENVKKLLFLASSCIYPKLASQPLKEESLLSGSLEPSNEAHAIAKIAGIKMCQSYREQYGCNFISVLPTNLYGANDNFNLESCHVIPALMKKFHHAKQNGDQSVTIWGTGKAKREFLHVEDLVSACVFLMKNYHEKSIINVGSGSEITIAELAEQMKKVISFEGEIEWDHSKKDGVMRKLLDNSKLNELGWKHSIRLEEGLQKVYASAQHFL